MKTRGGFLVLAQELCWSFLHLAARCSCLGNCFDVHLSQANQHRPAKSLPLPVRKQRRVELGYNLKTSMAEQFTWHTALSHRHTSQLDPLGGDNW